MLRKRVSGVNVTDGMLRMVRRLLLVAEIEQFEDSTMRIVGFHWSSQFSYVILYNLRYDLDPENYLQTALSP